MLSVTQVALLADNAVSGPEKSGPPALLLGGIAFAILLTLLFIATRFDKHK
jgi:hypothetical protein